MQMLSICMPVCGLWSRAERRRVGVVEGTEIQEDA
jgi:hypothetical protein